MALSQKGDSPVKAGIQEENNGKSKRNDKYKERRHAPYDVAYFLIEQAEHAGFHIVIAEPVNCVMEKVLLLKKQE